jgi:hypothetical protein
VAAVIVMMARQSSEEAAAERQVAYRYLASQPALGERAPGTIRRTAVVCELVEK